MIHPDFIANFNSVEADPIIVSDITGEQFAREKERFFHRILASLGISHLAIDQFISFSKPQYRPTKESPVLRKDDLLLKDTQILASVLGVKNDDRGYSVYFLRDELEDKAIRALDGFYEGDDFITLP